MIDELKVFAGSSNPALADEICGHLGVNRSGLTLSRYSNDNLSVQIDENVRERDVFVVQAFTEQLIDDRNDHMVERMLPRLAEGKAFIAVGALHLPGERGILKQLEDQGYRVTRVY